MNKDKHSFPSYLDVLSFDTLMVEFICFFSNGVIEISACTFTNVNIMIQEFITRHFHFFDIGQISCSTGSCFRYSKYSFWFRIFFQNTIEKKILSFIWTFGQYFARAFLLISLIAAELSNWFNKELLTSAGFTFVDFELEQPIMFAARTLFLMVKNWNEFVLQFVFHICINEREEVLETSCFRSKEKCACCQYLIDRSQHGNEWWLNQS